MTTLLRAKRALLLIAIALAVLLAPGAASAQSAPTLVSSTPSPGASVNPPPDTINLEFSEAIDPKGSGFTVIGTSGEVLERANLSSNNGGVTWSLSLTEPLGVGGYALNWSITTSGGAVANGSYGFFVGPSVQDLDTATATSPAEAEPPLTDNPIADGSGIEAPDANALVDGDQAPASVSELAPEEMATPEAFGETVAALASTPAATSASGGPATARWIGALARGLAFAGGLVAVGTFVFVVRVLNCKGPELPVVANLIRGGAVAVFTGTFFDLFATTANNFGGWGAVADIGHITDVLSGDHRIAVVLLLVAAGSLYVATRTSNKQQTTPHEGVVAAQASAPQAMAAAMQPRSVGAAVHPPYPPVIPTPRTPAHRVGAMTEIDRPLFGWVGAAAFALAYAFSGFSIGTGPASLMWIAGFVHVAAAAVWVGGLVAMGSALAFRKRRNLTSRATSMAIGFSVDAGISAAVVGFTGVVMAWLMVNEPADLVSSDWGRLMIIKLALTIVAGVIGAVNRNKLVPALEGDRDQQKISAELARTARTEVAVVAIAVLAAALATALI